MKEKTFAGKKSQICAEESAWTVEGKIRKFTAKELKQIVSIRIWNAESKYDDSTYMWIKVVYKDGKEKRFISFTPDFRLCKIAEHGDYLDPKTFCWYNLTDGDKVIERAMAKIMDVEDMPY